MGSSIMHICSAIELNKKNKTSHDEFFSGVIAPDILKLKLGKQKTHYMNIVKDRRDTVQAPIITKYVKQHHNDIIEQEYFQGILLHLIMDNIWFSKYIPKYAEVLDESGVEIRLLHNNQIVKNEEFTKQIYNDYEVLNKLIYKKYKKQIDNATKINFADNMNRYKEYNKYKINEVNIKEMIASKSKDKLKLIKYKDAISVINESVSTYQKIMKLL